MPQRSNSNISHVILAQGKCQKKARTRHTSSMLTSLQSLQADSPLETTVCIIGAGAAGITLACELDGASFKVLLIEAGGLTAALQAAGHQGGGAGGAGA